MMIGRKIDSYIKKVSSSERVKKMPRCLPADFLYVDRSENSRSRLLLPIHYKSLRVRLLSDLTSVDQPCLLGHPVSEVTHIKRAKSLRINQTLPDRNR